MPSAFSIKEKAISTLREKKSSEQRPFEPLKSTRLLLSRRQAAAHLGILTSCFSRLVDEGFLRPTDPDTKTWKQEELDLAVERLETKGFLPKTPTRKSEWRRFPLAVSQWRSREERPARLHTWSRHGGKRRKINLPYGSGAWVREWLDHGREHASRHPAAHQNLKSNGKSPATKSAVGATEPQKRAATFSTTDVPQNHSPAPPPPGQSAALITRKHVTRSAASAATNEAPRTPAELASKMRRRRAAVTQAEIARIIRAAKQAGASQLELRLNDSASAIVRLQPDNSVAPDEEIIL